MTAFPRFYPILDVTTLHRRGLSLPEAAAAMIDGGARILQLRLKENPSQRHLDDADSVSELCRRHGVIWIVNDRADIALLTSAGLHIGQDDMPAATARGLLGETAILGLSTHNPAQLRAATLEPVDYLAIGGITRDNAESVLDAGADSVAIIADLYPDPCDPSLLRQRVRDWTRITG